ncbi:hypothetical protein Btru_033747 [Bulinus truncatus]|nr:hypothetical protein Btru_033747 [Bulinus truncatus]
MHHADRGDLYTTTRRSQDKPDRIRISQSRSEETRLDQSLCLRQMMDVLNLSWGHVSPWVKFQACPVIRDDFSVSQSITGHWSGMIDGKTITKLLVRFPGVSVTASCFTLVAISLERHFAICHPLKSRSWQTLSHSYKAIGLCWVCAFGLMTPLAVFHDLQRVGETHTYRCREIWPSTDGLKAYTIIVNLFLLVFPIMIMCWAYGCVSYTLWIGIKMDKQTEKERQNKNGCANYDCHNGVSIYVNNKKMLMSPHEDETESPMNISTFASSGGGAGNFEFNKAVKPGQRPLRRFEAHRVMRQTNTEKSRAAKKRVIKMLFIIVLEFFVFWTPVYVVYTWMVFDFPGAQRNVTPMTKSLIHLLSYISACCNPITYCFMNKNFRQSFLMAFRCVKKRYVYAHRSQMSFSCNTASTRAPATPTLATSYDKIVDSDDISENSV